MILEALLQGGWNNDKEEEAEWSTDKKSDASDDEPNENSLVQSILKGANEQDMVQSALNSQTVSTW